jgi:hypothetical protein
MAEPTQTPIPFPGGGSGSSFPVTTPVTVNTGGSITTTGSGTIAATSVPFSGVAAGTNANALVIGSGGALTTSGTGTITPTPGGSTTQVQFNNSGVLAGNLDFTYNSATGLVKIGNGGGGGGVSAPQLTINGSTGQGNLAVGQANGSASTNITLGSGSSPFTTLTSTLGVLYASNGYGAPEITAPAGNTNNDILFADSVTHTWGHNSNNNGTMSFSGAWVNTNVTPVTVAASVTTDQNLMSVSIPAGTLNRVGRSLRVWCAGVYSTPAAQTEILTFKVKFGALTLISIPIPSQSFTATNNQFNITGYLTTQTGGATGVFESHGNLVIDLGVGNLVADSTFADQNTAVSSTIDLTAAQTLQITVSASVASTSNSFTQRQMVSETIG